MAGDGRPAKEDVTMHHLALLGEDEAAAAQPGTPAWDAEIAAHMRFSEVAADAIHGGEALQPVATAMTVRHGDGGEPLVTTGPYTETGDPGGPRWRGRGPPGHGDQLARCHASRHLGTTALRRRGGG
jgi:hypothetical protein